MYEGHILFSSETICKSCQVLLVLEEPPKHYISNAPVASHARPGSYEVYIPIHWQVPTHMKTFVRLRNGETLHICCLARTAWQLPLVKSPALRYLHISSHEFALRLFPAYKSTKHLNCKVKSPIREAVVMWWLIILAELFSNSWLMVDMYIALVVVSVALKK